MPQRDAMAKVKITVMKRLNYKDILGPNPQIGFTGAPECDRLEVGQEFVSDEGRFPGGVVPGLLRIFRGTSPTCVWVGITPGQGKKAQLFPAVQIDFDR